METFFPALMGIGALVACTMCVLEWIMSKPSETREIIAYIFFAIWVVGVIGHIILMIVK